MQEIQEIWAQSLGQEDPLEKEMATHSSILAWRIPWAEEPGGLWSIESQGVEHVTLYTHMHALTQNTIKLARFKKLILNTHILKFLWNDFAFLFAITIGCFLSCSVCFIHTCHISNMN